MVLFDISGALGAGKTLTLTFLGFKNWWFRRKPLFANYHLFKLPYIYIDSIGRMDQMREGFFCGDEFWLWMEALEKARKNKIVQNILLKSRKRDLTYAYTAQTLEQLKPRVRKVTDFTALPILNVQETVCKVAVWRTGYPTNGTYMKTFYFKTEVPMMLYNHREEVQEIIDEPDGSMTPLWQENSESETIEFKTWEDADKFAEQFWNLRQNAKLIRQMI